MPKEEADKLPPSVDLSSVAHAKFVFWKVGDNKAHIDPHCLSMPSDDIPIRGTREQAAAASHDAWCERCCKVMDRNWYEKTGSNDFEDWFEKTGNWFLKEDGTGICENSPVDENGLPWFIPYEDTIMP
ncbi:MAG: hypothetical protein HFE86_05135 [Clostridiales bacterium]|nr:hypothetical protein [Clostridiales bacterium]